MSLPNSIKRQSKSKGEKNDCAVKAVAIVANHPYEDVHQRMAASGRRPKRGTPMRVTFDVLRGLNVWYEKVKGPWTNRGFGRGSQVTVRRVKHFLPRKGRFLVVTSSHILAVINGEVKDWTANRRHQVIAVYQISF